MEQGLQILTNDSLFEQISDLIEQARSFVASTVNTAMTTTYYGIGRYFNFVYSADEICGYQFSPQCRRNSVATFVVESFTDSYAQQYALCLPDKQLLQAKLKEWIEELENDTN